MVASRARMTPVSVNDPRQAQQRKHRDKSGGDRDGE
jgi:hypothetical protein